MNFNQRTGHQMDLASMLGGVEKDSNGKIISAKSILTVFNLHLNFSEIDLNRVGNAAGTEDWATVDIMRFEEKFLHLMRKLKTELETNDTKIYYGAGRSYGDISSKVLFQDMDKLLLGIVFMMIYMILVLSKCSWPEIRYNLASVGILNVGMAYVSGCGLSSIFLFYSPVHASLFFIILGLGVDDIFVILAAMRKIDDEMKEITIPEKIAKTMQKAGASITITSITDIVAFVVGGSTVLPSLRSFCIFAAMCILMTYLYVITFFVAVLTLDEYRTAKNRNGIFPCIQHESRKPVWEPRLMQRAIRFVHGKLVLTKIGKIVVILSVIVITAFSMERLLNLKQKFDPMWFIPSTTYYHDYMIHTREFYPQIGYSAGVYMGHLNYSHEIPKIIRMSEEIEKRTDILSNVQSWPTSFHEYVSDFHDIDLKEVPINDTQWRMFLSKFLFSMQGGKFQQNIKFREKLECGNPAKDIEISSITFVYHRFEDREEFIPARDAILDILNSSNFTNKEQVFLWGKIFGNWFTDEIIDTEIYRNIVLALIGVFVCTAVLIANVQVCLYIFLCVLLSLISVGGFSQLWGLTLDIVTSIGLQLSVGLCIGL
jgi:predicted RND superfamily exporter protein